MEKKEITYCYSFKHVISMESILFWIMLIFIKGYMYLFLTMHC